MKVLALLLLLVAPASPDDRTSPQDGPPEPRGRRQVERVMNAGLPFAEKLLAEKGEFAPFGAVMLPTGLIQNVGTEPPDAEASTETLYAELLDALRAGSESEDYRVVATFAMVELRDPADGRIVSAVHVGLEHRDGYCVDIYYPTLLRGEQVILGESIAVRREGLIFDSCNDERTPDDG
jgi:hypothetical protein